MANLRKEFYKQEMINSYDQDQWRKQNKKIDIFEEKRKDR
jgi:hypothetical protein